MTWARFVVAVGCVLLGSMGNDVNLQRVHIVKKSGQTVVPMECCVAAAGFVSRGNGEVDVSRQPFGLRRTSSMFRFYVLDSLISRSIKSVS